MDEAADVANKLAAEHLQILTNEPRKIAKKIVNAGAIFLGPYTPVAVGDYVAGPSHVLPTGGSARFFSGLGAQDFYKCSHVLSYTKSALEEAEAARTIAERGVQLIGTAHGNVLDNILKNPTLSDLVGGIQSVILSDEEAKRRHTQKAVLERKAPPTFDIAVEIRELDKFAIYFNVASAIDSLLRARTPHPEIRVRTSSGTIEVKQTAREEIPDLTPEQEDQVIEEKGRGPMRIYPFGINKTQLERALIALELPAVAVGSLDEADIVLTTKPKARAGTRFIKSTEEHGVPVHVVRKNTSSQVMRFLKYYFKVGGKEGAEDIALREAEEAMQQVKNTRKAVDLSPQNAYIRRLQHQLIKKDKLHSESVGEEPKRRLRIYP